MSARCTSTPSVLPWRSKPGTTLSPTHRTTVASYGQTSPRRIRHAFTLVEVLVSVTLLSIILAILLSVTSQTQQTWSDTRGTLEQFRESRNAYELVSRKLRQATLNNYWDYEFPGGDTTKPPLSYQRQSELRYISGPASALQVPGEAVGHALFFQAPLGRSDSSSNSALGKLLNTTGYFLDLRDGKDDLPSFYASLAPERWRLRLYEFTEPSESLSVYGNTSGNPSYQARDWFTTPLANAANVRPIAENIVALIVRPKYAIARKSGGTTAEVELAPDYTYDSSGGLSGGTTTKQLQLHQLPPTVQLTMVAIDEASAARLNQSQLKAIGSKVNSLFSSRSNAYDQNIAIVDDSSNSQSLEQYLIDLGVSYRIHSSVINISGAKQSQ